MNTQKTMLVLTSKNLETKLGVHAGQSIIWSSAPYSMEEAQKHETCREQVRNSRTDDRTVKSKEVLSQEMIERSKKIDKCNEKYFNVVSIEPEFARSTQAFYCTVNRQTRKRYYYFPEVPPRIVHGRRLGPIDTDGRYNWTTLLVPDTDHINRYEQTARQINAHWFIDLF